jgi:hypothetical protein
VVVESVNELESSIIPLLAVMQGVAERTKEYREASADRVCVSFGGYAKFS